MALRNDGQHYAWHMQSVEEIFKQLGTGVDGLTEAEAGTRLRRYGLNRPAKEERTSFLQVALHQFQNPIIYILLIAGAVTLLLADFIDASVIYVVVLLNATIGFVQEYRAEESIRALKKLHNIY